ncbi:MAG: hypothetical protein ABSG64_00295 [Solirubrobacteraceae bacterium]|jgi:hypothetical protein
MSDWRQDHDDAKRRVGMATPGTVQYAKNAAKVLATHAGPNMRPETRAKLESLAMSDDAETSQVARAALRGVSYF